MCSSDLVNTIYILFLNNEFFIYLLPFAMLPIISTILGNRVYAIIMTFSNMIILSREESWFLVTIAVSLVAIYKAASLVSRSDIVKLSFFLGIFQALMSFSYGLVNQSSFGLMMLMIVPRLACWGPVCWTTPALTGSATSSCRSIFPTR